MPQRHSHRRKGSALFTALLRDVRCRKLLLREPRAYFVFVHCLEDAPAQGVVSGEPGDTPGLWFYFVFYITGGGFMRLGGV